MLALDGILVLQLRRWLEHGVRHVPEAVVAPLVADAVQHDIPVPLTGPGLCRYRQLVTGATASSLSLSPPRQLGRHGEAR
jgi:hypothetical protein